MRKHEKTFYSKSTVEVICNDRNIFYPAHLDDMGKYGVDSE